LYREIVILAATLGLILACAEFFTNGVEWLGRRLRLPESAVGSVLAAVGTALPETLIPFVAILLVGGSEGRHVGVGAILGAPFMLATLAFFVTGAADLYFHLRRRTRPGLTVDRRLLRRDLGHFLVLYSLALGAAFVHIYPLRVAISLLLLVGYLVYLRATFRSGGELGGEQAPLHLYSLWALLSVSRRRGENEEELRSRRQQRRERPPRGRFILLQVGLALGGIIAGAFLFTRGVTSVAHTLGVSALTVSLILAPIATELPEKFNSVVWVRQGKDTLALGNITGAMVFQSTFPVSLGILATEWDLTSHAAHGAAPLVTAIIALFSAALVILLSRRGSDDPANTTSLSPWVLAAGLPLYLVFVLYLRLSP
jgi:cation:H+ antiporter